MRESLLRRGVMTALGGLLLLGSQACVTPGGVYGTSVSYGVDFYEPYGYEYGGWGPTYYIGPPLRGEWRPYRRPYVRPYRPRWHGPRPGRPMPSIPSRPRTDRPAQRGFQPSERQQQR